MNCKKLKEKQAEGKFIRKNPHVNRRKSVEMYVARIIKSPNGKLTEYDDEVDKDEYRDEEKRKREQRKKTSLNPKIFQPIYFNLQV